MYVFKKSPRVVQETKKLLRTPTNASTHTYDAFRARGTGSRNRNTASAASTCTLGRRGRHQELVSYGLYEAAIEGEN